MKLINSNVYVNFNNKTVVIKLLFEVSFSNVGHTVSDVIRSYSIDCDFTVTDVDRIFVKFVYKFDEFDKLDKVLYYIENEFKDSVSDVIDMFYRVEKLNENVGLLKDNVKKYVDVICYNEIENRLNKGGN